MDGHQQSQGGGGRADHAALERFENQATHGFGTELKPGVLDAFFNGLWADPHQARNLFLG
ncbi:hypothetical protein D3C86_1967560 [compost metagenome]